MGIKKYQFDENFIETYNNDSDMGYFIEVEAHYPEKLHVLF